MARKTEADEGYLEVQMDGRQVVIVVVGVLLLCAISFYFGVRVGRAEAASRSGPELTSSDSPTIELDDEDAAADLTFFDSVGERPSPSAVPATAEPAPKEAPEEAQKEAHKPAIPDRDGPPSPGVAAKTPSPGPPGEQPSSTAARTGYEIQVGVFSTRAQAERLVARLREKNFAAAISPTGNRGKVNYRVRVGGYGSLAAAESDAARLRNEEKLQTWIPPQGG
ncbi:MAG: SPOR domain-containing protein [Acidobacteriota bacterium]